MAAATLSAAWKNKDSPIFFSKNVKEIIKYTRQNGIDISKTDIKRFLERQRSSNVLPASASRVKIAQTGKSFLLEPRFFSQLHGDIFFLTKNRKYNTSKRKIMIIVCALSKMVFMRAMTKITSNNMIAGLKSVIADIKLLDSGWHGGKLFTDSGTEWKNSAFTLYLKSVHLKSNIVRIRPYRYSKGSGISERHVKRARMAIEAVRMEKNNVDIETLLDLATRKLNNEHLSSIGTSAIDAFENHNAFDIVMILNSYRLRTRKYLKRPMEVISIGTIVKIRLFTDKTFAEKESYGRYSCYFVIISIDRSRDIEYYILADVLNLQRLNASYSAAELLIVDIDYFSAVHKAETGVDSVIMFKDDVVLYKSLYRGHEVIAKKSLMD